MPHNAVPFSCHGNSKSKTGPRCGANARQKIFSGNWTALGGMFFMSRKFEPEFQVLARKLRMPKYAKKSGGCQKVFLGAKNFRRMPKNDFLAS